MLKIFDHRGCIYPCLLPKQILLLNCKGIFFLCKVSRPTINSAAVDIGLGRIKYAFPDETFPLGAIHEFICSASEALSAAGGFVAGILSSLMHHGGVSIWISSSQTIFPPALKIFGIEPDKIIFIDLQKEKEIYGQWKKH